MREVDNDTIFVREKAFAVTGRKVMRHDADVICPIKS